MSGNYWAIIAGGIYSAFFTSKEQLKLYQG
jgi:hypothetical protein